MTDAVYLFVGIVSNIRLDVTNAFRMKTNTKLRQLIQFEFQKYSVPFYGAVESACNLHKTMHITHKQQTENIDYIYNTYYIFGELTAVHGTPFGKHNKLLA